MEELLQHFVSRSIADKKKSNDLELVRHNSWWNLCKIFDQIMADLLDRSCQKRYIKSWVKKCYIKSWLIYLTAMLYQILTNILDSNVISNLGKIHHIRTRLMSCAKSERRGQNLVTCDLTKEEKCEQDIFFSYSKQMGPNTSVQDICVILTDWLTYVMGIIFTDAGLLFREGRKKGPHNRILLA